MKKHYIIPTSETVAFRTASLCDPYVGSVHGNTNLQYNGAADPGDPVM